jgi:hypothetical protein
MKAGQRCPDFARDFTIKDEEEKKENGQESLGDRL